MTLIEAKKILGEIVDRSGDLYRLGSPGYVNWYSGELEITLDGSFTAEELEAFAVIMRAER